jgi:hypothetical protein
MTVNQRVAGSSPASGARVGKHGKTVACPYFFFSNLLLINNTNRLV